MLHIEYLLPIIAFWHTITNQVGKYKKDHAVANNIVCAIHSLVFSLHYNYNYNLNYAIHASFGYYIYDLFYIFQCIRVTSTSSVNIQAIKQRAVYIVHHIIGLFLLYDTLTTHNIGPLLKSYYLLESSNLLLYVSYHLHKEYREHKTMISFSEFIQLLWYSYFRVYLFSICLYENQQRFFEFPRMGQIFIAVIYLMGIVWTCNLMKRNISNYLAMIS